MKYRIPRPGVLKMNDKKYTSTEIHVRRTDKGLFPQAAIKQHHKRAETQSRLLLPHW